MGRSIFYLHSHRKDDRFSNSGGFFFLLRILQTKFLKLPTKNEPLGFHFSKDTNKNVRVILSGGREGGGGGRLWIQMDAPICICKKYAVNF